MSQALSYMPRIHPLVKTGDKIIYHINVNIRMSIENALSGMTCAVKKKKGGLLS